MFNNPYMYSGFSPNNSFGLGAMRGVNPGMSMGMNAMRGGGFRPAGMGALRGSSGLASGMNAARGMSGGLFSRLGGAFSALRGFNWGGLINNASKTIGVINQTIPLVKQAGPMIRNMRSVMKIASIFKDETDPVTKKSSTNVENISEEKKENSSSLANSNVSDNAIENRTSDSDYSSINSPVFFVS